MSYTSREKYDRDVLYWKRLYYVRGAITRRELNAKLADAQEFWIQSEREARRAAKTRSPIVVMSKLDVRFAKTGKQIKEAAARLVDQLQQRLDRRNEALERFMNDRKLVRSFLVRSSKGTWSGHTGFTWPQDSIASEQLEETRQLCERIYDLEQEIYQLRLVIAHLEDDRVFELTLEEAMTYGFAPEP